jgi:hypothetical protein
MNGAPAAIESSSQVANGETGRDPTAKPMLKIEVLPEAVTVRPDYQNRIFENIPSEIVSGLRIIRHDLQTLRAEKDKRGGSARAEYKRQVAEYTANPGTAPAPVQEMEIQARWRMEKNHFTDIFVRKHALKAYALMLDLCLYLQEQIEVEVSQLLERDKKDSDFLGIKVPTSFAAQVLSAELARIDGLKEKIRTLRSEVEAQIPHKHAIARFEWPGGCHIVSEAIALIDLGELKGAKKKAEVSK